MLTPYSLPLSAHPEYVAIPSDPSVPFTPEQEAAFFAGDVRSVLRSLVLNASRDADFMRRLAAAPAAPSPHPRQQPSAVSTRALEKEQANVP